MKTNKAFTLIEVLVVTAVISLMASIVSANVSASRQKAEDAHMKTEVQQVRNAVELYRQDNGGVPIPTVPEGSSYVAGSMVAEDTNEYKSSMQKLVPKYIPEVPTSPSGLSYSYLATADEEDAVFAAVLNNDDTSDGSNNSCEVIETSVDFKSCSDQKEFYCSDLGEVDSSQVCIDRAYGYCEYDYDICGYVSTDTNLMSDNYCQQYNTYDYCSGMNLPGFSSAVLCEYNGSACSGTSNSDYCSCI